MKSTILLNSGENTRIVEDEEKARFVYSILEIMQVPINDFWIPDQPLSVEGKAKLRNVLSLYNIDVIDEAGGDLDIYVDKQKIAGWKKCEYKLKRDLSQIDPKKQMFLEMQVDFWSVFEKE